MGRSGLPMTLLRTSAALGVPGAVVLAAWGTGTLGTLGLYAPMAEYGLDAPTASAATSATVPGATAPAATTPTADLGADPSDIADAGGSHHGPSGSTDGASATRTGERTPPTMMSFGHRADPDAPTVIIPVQARRGVPATPARAPQTPSTAARSAAHAATTPAATTATTAAAPSTSSAPSTGSRATTSSGSSAGPERGGLLTVTTPVARLSVLSFG